MRIIDIFAVSENENIYAVQWDEFDCNEFERVLDNLTDPQYLFEFFTKHQQDLGFFPVSTIDEAVCRTRQEALELKETLLTLDQSKKTHRHESLDKLFQPLTKLESHPDGFERHKAYGHLEKSMIRIYAIRLDTNKYLVTGGAIKLTDTMQARNHTTDELTKMSQCTDYLKENGIYL